MTFDPLFHLSTSLLGLIVNRVQARHGTQEVRGKIAKLKGESSKSKQCSPRSELYVQPQVIPDKGLVNCLLGGLRKVYLHI